MKRTLKIGVPVLAASMLALVACGSSSKDASPVTTTTTPSGAGAATPAYVAMVKPQMEQLMKANAIPGAVVLIRSPSKGDWAGTFGTTTIGADKPMSLGDYFRIGSNTKTMTSTVILQLVEEGKLKLDDAIAKYIPGVPNGDKVTIANLLEMRSGLYSYSFDPAFNATLDKDPQKAWTPEELLKIAFSHPVNGPPGQTFDYSNTNIILLGLVIEKLTGMSASEAFQKRLF